MIIAQFNYFIWPFVVLCILNILILCNIWTRSRRMNHFTKVKTSLTERRETMTTCRLGLTEDDQQLSIY